MGGSTGREEERDAVIGHAEGRHQERCGESKVNTTRAASGLESRTQGRENLPVRVL